MLEQGALGKHVVFIVISKMIPKIHKLTKTVDLVNFPQSFIIYGQKLVFLHKKQVFANYT